MSVGVLWEVVSFGVFMVIGSELLVLFRLRVIVMFVYLFNRMIFFEGDFIWFLEEFKKELSINYGG